MLVPIQSWFTDDFDRIDFLTLGFLDTVSPSVHFCCQATVFNLKAEEEM